MRNFLNVLADILTLLAVAISGIGHMFPWYQPSINMVYSEARETDYQKQLKRQQEMRDEHEAKVLAVQNQLFEMQSDLAIKSGASLGLLALLASASLVIPWGATGRRLLVLLMFASAVSAVVFINMGFSPYFVPPELSRTMREDYPGFPLALAPACVAGVLCLIRMLWTMPPQRDLPKVPS